MVVYNQNAYSEIFNVATGKPNDINSLTKLIMKLTEKKEDLNINYGPKRLGDILHNYADISKIKKKTKFLPDYQINNGIQEYISFLKKSIQRNNNF